MKNVVTVIQGIGRIATGNANQPETEGDTIRIDGSVIEAVGKWGEIQTDDADVVIDAVGLDVIPGLFDGHVHPMIGDWNPRQSVMGWMEAAFHGGVTSMISQGIVHLPNQPHDRETTKALAALSTTIWRNHRPGGGLKMHSGALMLEEGLERTDFMQLADIGVRLIAEIGGGGLWEYDRVRPMIDWARQAGMVVPLHFGAASYPGSVDFGADEAVAYDPDVLVHVNGGSTAKPVKEAIRAIEATTAFAEVIHCGNIRAAVEIVGCLRERREMDRLLIGSDSPVGHGAIPLAMVKTCSQVASLAGLAGEEIVPAATGNVARAYGIDGVGQIGPGFIADILIVDRPTGSEARSGVETLSIGDVPAVTYVLVDGRLVTSRARNTTSTDRLPRVVRGEDYVGTALQEVSTLPPLFR